MKKAFFLFVCLLLQANLQSQEMEIMTYNIKYLNETDGENSWSKRKDHLTNQIKFYEPGIFGVQEAVKQQLDHLKTNLAEYDYIGEGRDGGSKGEYSAIFFDTGKFDLLEEGTFWLSETPTK
ncbi:MAG TPA: endonuclease/exonuclease/phosphatase, partial [Salinimicrobium catena]|nr:endonuclease/exonuclease/phosphatase [Salinimicrobium catena]